jgi:hypothetical protein
MIFKVLFTLISGFKCLKIFQEVFRTKKVSRSFSAHKQTAFLPEALNRVFLTNIQTAEATFLLPYHELNDVRLKTVGRE